MTWIERVYEQVMGMRKPGIRDRERVWRLIAGAMLLPAVITITLWRNLTWTRRS